ncbi:Protein kinase-like domain containing protein [Rhypophila sp. PSN 637]
MSLDGDYSYYHCQQDSQPGSQPDPDSNRPSQSDGVNTSNGSSQNSGSNSPSQNHKDPLTDLIPVRDYLTLRDYDNFTWDDADKETSEKWLRPVREARLDETKHKVFHHSNREFLIPGTHPFCNLGDLGQSGSNIVYKVTSPPAQQVDHRRPLALKVILCTDKSRGSPGGPRSRARKQALEEVRNMSRIRHSHIVVYVASFEDYCIHTTRNKRIKNGVKVTVVQEEIRKHILGIAMYPPARYNLRELMEHISKSNNRGHTQRKEARYMHGYFGCLSQAVAYLHKSDVQIRHKDIKPANIVIDENHIPLLTDFGLSKHFEIGKESDGPTAKTVKYAEPEAVRETRRNMRSDIFPLGCVFLEMATTLLGKEPSFAEMVLSGLTSRSVPGSRPFRSTGEFQYSDEESLRRLPGYLGELEGIAKELISKEHEAGAGGTERSAKAIIDILPVISEMMDENIKGRPFAKDLFPRFRHLYQVYPKDVGFCKSCEEEISTGGERSFPLFPTASMLAAATGNGNSMRNAVTRSSTLVSMASMPSSPSLSRAGSGTGIGFGDGSSGKENIRGGGGRNRKRERSDSGRGSSILGMKRHHSWLAGSMAG